jgi:hypothetical protein
VLEPWVERNEDLSVGLYLAPDRSLQLLGTLRALIAPTGVPLGHSGEIDSRGRVYSGSECDDEMRAAAAAIATAAAEAGFHGPCGVDGFRFRDPTADGFVRLRAVCEFNARFTTGVVLLGLLRRERARIRKALELEPGQRAFFCFALEQPGPPGAWRDLERGARERDPRTLLICWPPVGEQTEQAVSGLLLSRDAGALEAALRAITSRSTSAPAAG